MGTLPAGVVYRLCARCQGTGMVDTDFEHCCQECQGAGRRAVEAATGAPVRLLVCGNCQHLVRLHETRRHGGRSVCPACYDGVDAIMARLFEPITVHDPRD